MGIRWENTAAGTEFPCNFCARISLLQLGIVLVYQYVFRTLMFLTTVTQYYVMHYTRKSYKLCSNSYTKENDMRWYLRHLLPLCVRLSLSESLSLSVSIFPVYYFI